MSEPIMFSIEILGIYTIELVHPFGQVGVRRFNQQMILITHQAVGMAYPVIGITDFT
jgi:hypothetical protein